MVKTWVSRNKDPTQNWIYLVSIILEDGSQLLWKCYLWEEARIFEQQEKAKGLQASQDKIIDERIYADPKDQALHDEHILSLSHTKALNS